jgi:hypothetical protein
MLSASTIALVAQIVGLLFQLITGATQLLPVIENAWATLKGSLDSGSDITDAQLEDIKAQAAAAHAGVQA